MGTLKKADQIPDAEKFRLRILARAACILLRREWEIGQAELAVLCKTHQQCISLIEHGRPRAPVRVCRLLIEAAGIVRVEPTTPRRPLAENELEARA